MNGESREKCKHITHRDGWRFCGADGFSCGTRNQRVQTIRDQTKKLNDEQLKLLAYFVSCLTSDDLGKFNHHLKKYLADKKGDKMNDKL
jgi:hypothetical protein